MYLSVLRGIKPRRAFEHANDDDIVLLANGPSTPNSSGA